MQTSSLRAVSSCDEHDVTGALCHALELPLEHLLGRIERAGEVLRRRPANVADQSTLQLAYCLADARDTVQHLARVVADVRGWTRGESRRLRPLDLRVAVRAAAAMAERRDGRAADIAIDAPEPMWVDGIDTRLVHVFTALFAAALTEADAIVARLALVDGEITVELRLPGAGHAPSEDARPLGRALVRHIVAAHGGHLELGPAAGAGNFARVTLPPARAARPHVAE
ncbi:MAG TPA: hypothetical protein VN947_11790 [Polyangia bacterium]|nr:hypothetical protein [Polyangia bacterium]